MSAELKARRIISLLSLEQIIDQFEITETLDDPDIPTVRGWLMDELQKRDRDAFDRWLSDFADSPRPYFL